MTAGGADSFIQKEGEEENEGGREDKKTKLPNPCD